jgi:hypothetical protein
MYYPKSWLLLTVIASFALVAQAQILDTAIPEPVSSAMYDKTCLTNEDEKGIVVSTKECQSAIDMLLDGGSEYINPPSIGWVELASAGKCSISIRGNEAIKKELVGIAAQRIHAECKPVGRNKKHVVAGRITVAGFERADGSTSGPATIVLAAKLKGLQARSENEDNSLASATRVHARDLHAWTSTPTAKELDARTPPTSTPSRAPTYLVNGGNIILQMMMEQRPAAPLVSQDAIRLADNMASGWGQQRAQEGGTYGSISIRTNPNANAELGAYMVYDARGGYNIDEIDPQLRRTLAIDFQNFRIMRGNPWFFAVEVWLGRTFIGQMAMDVGDQSHSGGGRP